MNRKIIGYNTNASIKYIINEKELNIISSHPKLQINNETLIKKNTIGFISEDKVNSIKKMIESL